MSGRKAILSRVLWLYGLDLNAQSPAVAQVEIEKQIEHPRLKKNNVVGTIVFYIAEGGKSTSASRSI